MLTKDLKCWVDYCFENRRTGNYCARHYTSWWRNGSSIWADVVAFPTSPDPNIKFCTKCLEPKTLDEYHARVRNGKERVDGACKKCIIVQSDDYRRNRRPEHVTEKSRLTAKLSIAKKKYGKEGLEAKKRILDGSASCEICGEASRLVIDHCHDSDMFRGILCNNCNTALGLVHESVEKMNSMIKYIETKGKK